MNENEELRMKLEAATKALNLIANTRVPYGAMDYKASQAALWSSCQRIAAHAIATISTPVTTN